MWYNCLNHISTLATKNILLFKVISIWNTLQFKKSQRLIFLVQLSSVYSHCSPHTARNLKLYIWANLPTCKSQGQDTVCWGEAGGLHIFRMNRKLQMFINFTNEKMLKRDFVMEFISIIGLTNAWKYWVFSNSRGCKL